MLLGRPLLVMAYSDFRLCEHEKSPELQELQITTPSSGKLLHSKNTNTIDNNSHLH